MSEKMPLVKDKTRRYSARGFALCLGSYSRPSAAICRIMRALHRVLVLLVLMICPGLTLLESRVRVLVRERSLDRRFECPTNIACMSAEFPQTSLDVFICPTATYTHVCSLA